MLRDAGQLMAVESGASDWTRGLRGCLTWGIPVAILVITPERYLVIVWPAALTFMGVACLLNARRCGRIHCYATGPFFLLLAVFGLLYGIGLLPLGDRGWTKLSTALVIGSVVLICVPEWARLQRFARMCTKEWPRSGEFRIGNSMTGAGGSRSLVAVALGHRSRLSAALNSRCDIDDEPDRLHALQEYPSGQGRDRRHRRISPNHLVTAADE